MKAQEIHIPPTARTVIAWWSSQVTGLKSEMPVLAVIGGVQRVKDNNTGVTTSG